MTLLFCFAKVNASEIKLSYNLQQSLNWQESDLMALEDRITSYTLKDYPKLVMTFTYIDSDFSEVIKQHSLDKLIEHILAGKSTIFSMMNVETTLIGKKLTKEKNVSVLHLKTSYVLGKSTYFLIEKFYIVKGETLLTSLRWTSNEEQSDIFKDALKDFENVKVNQVITK